MPVLPSDVVIVAYPLRNGTQALMPRRVTPRSCVRLDGKAKAGYASRAVARRSCAKHENVYRCRFCAAWHRATKRKPNSLCDTLPVAWIKRRAA